jgi:hypothetical protein
MDSGAIRDLLERDRTGGACQQQRRSRRTEKKTTNTHFLTEYNGVK